MFILDFWKKLNNFRTKGLLEYGTNTYFTSHLYILCKSEVLIWFLPQQNPRIFVVIFQQNGNSCRPPCVLRPDEDDHGLYGPARGVRHGCTAHHGSQTHVKETLGRARAGREQHPRRHEEDSRLVE